MGNGVIYKCKKCKYENYIRYGVGMREYPSYYSENNFRNLIQQSLKDTIGNIDELLDFIGLENANLDKGYGADVYVCDKCKYVQNRFNFSLSSGTKKFFPVYKCPYCNSILRVRGERNYLVNKIKCCKCGGEDFEEGIYYDFD